MGNTHQSSIHGTCLEFIRHKLLKSQFSRLIGAIKDGNLNKIKSFHDSKVNFNATLRSGDTPVHIAVKYSKLGIVKFLAENVYYLDFNERNFAGDTPLMVAVMNEDLKIVEYLVNKKTVDINIAENRGFTPFMAACANGNIQILKFLVKNGSNFRVKSKDGQTGLHRAAFYGNIDAVKYLIKDLKINIMVPDKKGNLPLHQACMQLNFSCIRLLLRASKNLTGLELLHTKNKYGVRPIDLLLKVMNQVRTYEDPRDFEIDQIEEYIRDKRNIPVLKREQSPSALRQKPRSATAFARLKKTVIVPLESPKSGIIIPQSPKSQNESTINLRPVSPNGSLVMFDKKSRDIFEDEIVKNSRGFSQSISDLSPVPLLYNKESSLGSIDSSPKAARQKKVRISSLAYINESRPAPLQLKSNIETNSSVKPRSTVRFATASSIELKNSSPILQLTPSKSRFASPSPITEDEY